MSMASADDGDDKERQKRKESKDEGRKNMIAKTEQKEYLLCGWFDLRIAVLFALIVQVVSERTLGEGGRARECKHGILLICGCIYILLHRC